MRILVLALVLASSSCSSTTGGKDMASGGSGGGGSGGSGGGAPGDMKTGPTSDMIHPLMGVSCGNMQCADSAQYCCTSDNGSSGTCNDDNDFNCGGYLFNCDGPEDCPPGLAECCFVAGSTNSQCVSTGQCATMNGVLMCHKPADCNNGSSCCFGKVSPYGLCEAPCPG